ncbi:hypothetical protein FOL47_003667 [Perkinsus chesapeaki]|uniref:Uncharacterized protein n=1 Tax=Perkinsus chesapeaki TaxID=330153 RepID=A0A7J6M714_PERCH|nr:hypothetical protein FOL47_003667 [Perkinsus chesapeaki]
MPDASSPSESLTWEERINATMYNLDRKLNCAVKKGLSGESTFYAIGGLGVVLMAATAIGALTFRRKANEFARLNPAMFAKHELSQTHGQMSAPHRPGPFIPLASAVLTPRETVKLFVLPFIVVSGGIFAGWKARLPFGPLVYHRQDLVTKKPTMVDQWIQGAAPAPEWRRQQREPPAEES